MRSTGKILVIRGGAIGDFILTFPVFSALRAQFPETHLEVLGYPHIAQLALSGGLVDQMQSIEARALAGFFALQGTLDPQLQEYFGSFALIISYLYDPDLVFQTNVARCSKAQFLAGPHRPDETLNLHATEALLKPLERLAIFAADPVPRLRIDAPSLVRLSSPGPSGSFSTRTIPPDEPVAEQPCPDGTETSSPCQNDGSQIFVAIHPGSGSERKNWPETKWVELLKRMAVETGWKFLLIGGEAEGERIIRLARSLPAARVSLAQNLPLNVLAMQLQACEFFVGHDSGISHLAAALGLGGLVLWGETNLQVWRPRSERFTVLRADGGFSQLEPDRVWAEIRAVQPRLDTRPR